MDSSLTADEKKDLWAEAETPREARLQVLARRLEQESMAHLTDIQQHLEVRFRLLEVRENDVLFLLHPGHLSETACFRISETAKRVLPGMKITVLEEGMDAIIVRPVAAGK